MTEQVQRQPRRQEKEEVTQEDQTFDRSETDAVLEGCDSCLADIDSVLEEVGDRELTDDEVYAKGAPNHREYGDWASYKSDLDRFKEAYENVTGMTYQKAGRCGC